jgi:hypothetical protein
MRPMPAIAAMRAGPAFPLYHEEDLVDVAAVANPVPIAPVVVLAGRRRRA